MSGRPKVSVLIVTYNQAEWIAQAIDSALMQIVDFPVEIVIGDDFSDDGTRAILEEYRARHPDVIRLNLQDAHPSGVPGRINQVSTLKACCGEYVAFLDGDDFWTDTGKLARQVALLDADAGLSGVAHDAIILHEGPSSDDRTRFSELAFEDHGVLRRATMADLLVSPVFQTSTWMVRSDAVRILPGWYETIPAADWGLFVIAAEHGDTLVEPSASSVYRRHARSILAQLRDECAAARNRWHRTSFVAVSRAFPNALRGRRWRRVDARSRLNEHVDQRRPLLAVLDALMLFAVHDRRRIVGFLSDPCVVFRRVRLTLRRMSAARSGLRRHEI